MNVNVLIDAIVRQTTVLIAQLATAAGLRAPLAHTANQVFLDLVRELKEQGVGNKVIADMFGLALSTYHSKIRRLSESRSERGRSLWKATLAFIKERGAVTQADVLKRFQYDDGPSVRGVLNDLVESGMVFRAVYLGGYRNGVPVVYSDAVLQYDEAADAGLQTRTLNTLTPIELTHTFTPEESSDEGVFLRVYLLSADGDIPTTVHIESFMWTM
jgi:hypothetical protein